MVIKSEFGIYSVLERHLKAASQPLTCVDLFAKNDVKKFATSANKVSDYLGHMWRRGLLDRFYAPKESTSMARYGYLWKEQPTQAEPEPVVQQSPARRSKVDITEKDGAVEIRMEKVVITIRSA
jgi:hypothetical protein